MLFKRFKNIHTNSRSNPLTLMRFVLGFYDEPFAFLSHNPKDYTPKIVEPNLEIIQHPNTEKIQATWIGHSSFLVQCAGLNILTDPIFSRRASPLQFVGPERMVEPGISFNALPKVDIVVISHDHYDHLDYDTVKQLGNTPLYVVPSGLKQWFKRHGITNVVELPWWGEHEHLGAKVTCAPAQHFSGRVPFMFNKTLWSAWVIEKDNKKIFFGGDAGYSPHYKEIYERMGSMDLSLIPIGAYHPRFMMRDIHVDPREAVMIHKDIHSNQSIGMHWGTFRLTTEPTAEPPLYLKGVLEEEGIPQKDFVTIPFGETFIS